MVQSIDSRRQLRRGVQTDRHPRVATGILRGFATVLVLVAGCSSPAPPPNDVGVQDVDRADVAPEAEPLDAADVPDNRPADGPPSDGLGGPDGATPSILGTWRGSVMGDMDPVTTEYTVTFAGAETTGNVTASFRAGRLSVGCAFSGQATGTFTVSADTVTVVLLSGTDSASMCSDPADEYTDRPIDAGVLRAHASRLSGDVLEHTATRLLLSHGRVDRRLFERQ